MDNMEKSFQEGYKNKLINNVFKMLGLREDHKDWMSHLDTVIIELYGLQKRHPSINLWQLIGKLAAAKFLSFTYYRKTVFECISIIEKLNLTDENKVDTEEG